MAKRFYEPQDLSHSPVQVSERNKHYIANVLRMRAGDTLHVFNETQGEYAAQLLEVSKKSVTLAIVQPVERHTESRLRVHIGIVVSKGDRFDYAIQKSTELGVTAITPLFSERCDVKLKGDRLEKRQQHWQEVAISASEQCLRTQPPVIHAAQKFGDWITDRDEDTRWVLHTADGTPSDNAIGETVAVLIGPEGGLTDDEVSAAQSQGFLCKQLGQRVLRTETAPVVALSVLHTRAGDFIDDY